MESKDAPIRSEWGAPVGNQQDASGRRARVVRKRIGTGERLRPRPHGQAYRQKFLNLSGASSVYRTVCWMFLCPSHACSALVSWPALASA